MSQDIPSGRMAREAGPAVPLDAALDIRLHGTIAAIDAQQWERLRHPGQFCRHDYLLALEQSRIACQFLYATAWREGQLIGAAVATLWSLRLCWWAELKVGTVGTPLNTGLAMMLAGDDGNTALAGSLIAALEKASVARGARLFVARDFPAPHCCGQASLDLLYRRACLVLQQADFAAFVASHPRGKHIRREIRSLEKAGYTVEIRRASALSLSEAQRLHQLWLQLFHKHRSADQIEVSPAFFASMSRLPHALLLLLRREQQIDAFDLCFILGDELESTYCGVDLARTARLSVHRAMGYHIVRVAYEAGLRRINFGISNEQQKQEMGCQFDGLYARITASPRWLGGPLRYLLRRFVLTPTTADGASQQDSRKVAG
ncbi:GNAT family N-acetyltransferase [Herbaspirillum seropedicae]|nr:GNAT family N-acetyltransferase [Herbaspirillum seropedicae]AKN65491.1 hypothetical protein ACP92_09745 [Herbaspirillum seropedicae]NQE28650.1 hypothetical protein [Herbaspirillum seropedicae]UMU21458.1 GNAT family N-acetyltransferase [Herbaspirillum seropedicae]